MNVQNAIPIYFIVITGLGITVMASVIWFTALNITSLLMLELLALGSAAIGGLLRSLAPSLEKQ